MQNKEHAERAKIFLPFDSLKGFRECLKSKERIVVERKELSEDACEELNRKLQQVKKGSMIKIVYYDQGEYVRLKGMVSRIDVDYLHILQIVDKVVHIRDIVEMALEEV